jgi:hypothetical protein
MPQVLLGRVCSCSTLFSLCRFSAVKKKKILVEPRHGLCPAGRQSVLVGVGGSKQEGDENSQGHAIAGFNCFVSLYRLRPSI